MQDNYMTKRIYKTTNPYSGQSEMLTEEEKKLYMNIKLAEQSEKYDTMQKGLDKFSRLNPKAYMTLLDQLNIITKAPSAPWLGERASLRSASQPTLHTFNRGTKSILNFAQQSIYNKLNKKGVPQPRV